MSQTQHKNEGIHLRKSDTLLYWLFIHDEKQIRESICLNDMYFLLILKSDVNCEEEGVILEWWRGGGWEGISFIELGVDISTGLNPIRKVYS